MLTIEQMVVKAREDGASDIHIIQNLPPKYRKDGMLENMDEQLLTAEDCVNYAKYLAGSESAYRILEDAGELDAAATYEGNRCRIHIFKQQGVPSTALRLLSDKIPQLENLGLPPAALELPSLHKGIVH